jgi:hypothetical protein
MSLRKRCVALAIWNEVKWINRKGCDCFASLAITVNIFVQLLRVGCVRPNNLVKNRFPLSDAPYSISYSQSRKRRNFLHLYDGKLVSVRKS